MLAIVVLAVVALFPPETWDIYPPIAREGSARLQALPLQARVFVLDKV